MSNLLIEYVAKLERRCLLPSADREALLALPGEHRTVPAKDTLISAGQRTTHCVIILEGFVSRALRTKFGTQVVALHLPSDAIDLQSLFFCRTDHDIVAHTATETFWVAHQDILALQNEYKSAINALWLDTLVDSAIFRAWTANIGTRVARDRVGHFLLEVMARFEAINRLDKDDDAFILPITQKNMADALGLSLVHFNKTLKKLKNDGLLKIDGQSFCIPHRQKLAEITGFNSEYLHLNGANIEQGGRTGFLAAAQ